MYSVQLRCGQNIIPLALGLLFVWRLIKTIGPEILDMTNGLGGAHRVPSKTWHAARRLLDPNFAGASSLCGGLIFSPDHDCPRSVHNREPAVRPWESGYEIPSGQTWGTPSPAKWAAGSVINLPRNGPTFIPPGAFDPRQERMTYPIT
jgi:hypothetical protein